MTLTIYNTLTSSKQPFTSVQPGKVTMYCCGVTVYDYCHLGHARSYIVWDIVRRYLKWRGYQVRYVQNFTDIDDKILNRAKAEGSSMSEVSERFINAYFEDIRRLNVLDASEYPRVTEHISSIHQLIKALEEKGYAYAVDGDVYYNVRLFPEYGKLSKRQLEQMLSDASGRLDSSNHDGNKKQDSCDFALWKASKSGEPGWESPWGMGRPGWHIECSAMIRSRLGETIDIHGGGGDLVFPHHENEIAQSEVLTGKALAKYWLHNGMVTVNGEKMSKSLGNFTTIRQLLNTGVDPMAVRLFVLQAHYRKPLDFTPSAISAAQNSWETLKDGLLCGYKYGQQLGWNLEESVNQTGEPVEINRFQAAMDDDFNTSSGLAILFELAKTLRRECNAILHQGESRMSGAELQQRWQTLIHLADIFGLEANVTNDTKQQYQGDDSFIENLVEQRSLARKEKRFADSDRLRNELQVIGVNLIDLPNNETHWRRVT